MFPPAPPRRFRPSSPSRLGSALYPLAALAALATAACSEDPVAEVPSAAEQDAARAVVDQIGTLASLAEEPRNAELVLAATSAEPITRLLAPPGTRMVLPSHPGETERGLGDCATVTAYTVSFSECPIAEHVVDGTVSRQGHEVVADLDDVFLLDAGLHGAASISGRVVTEPPRLSGTVSIGAQWSVDGGQTLIDATVHLDHIELDPSGCPTGGAMLVTADLVGPDLRPRRAIRFGPACGDVTLEP